jgi:hypothetical protein
MLGAIITFVAVCAIVAVYMAIVHSFLREAEKIDEAPVEKQETAPSPRTAPAVEETREARWAH